jgi:TetR/AcrR family transcriptional repressor of nem operon
MSKSETSEMPETKRRLLEAAVQLMLRQGFTATTVDQICAEADLTKGSFFHYFKSKDEVGESALDYFHGKQQERFAGAKFNQLSDPLERIHGLLDFITEMAGPGQPVRGCLMGNLAQELAQTHPRIRARCDEKFSGFAGFIEATLREAKTKHRPNAKFDPKGVSLLFVSLLQGSMLVAKTRQDSALIADNLEHFRSYVDGLFDKARR